MTALEYFRLLAPEFASEPDATINQWLSIAGSLTDLGCMDAERAAMALALYAAHMLSIATSSGQNGGAATGVITSEKEGDLQRNYGAVSGGDTYMGKTSYGQQYLDITKSCFGAAIMTRV